MKGSTESVESQLLSTLFLYSSPMTDVYKTIEAPSEGLYKDKGSKFLSFALPVRSVDEVKERLEFSRIVQEIKMHVEHREYERK